ncbi:hypothetical protein [Bradyrhizobium zhanjiangense]|uniref:hypothetical protein n=1 Tax=Bradyrhizobium zhanjiangense TaxID=1325107 RepID=UPI001FE07D1E|nr:hypothetical protein [Bradyrhizobium zhanjiangense]
MRKLILIRDVAAGDASACRRVAEPELGGNKSEPAGSRAVGHIGCTAGSGSNAAGKYPDSDHHADDYDRAGRDCAGCHSTCTVSRSAGNQHDRSGQAKAPPALGRSACDPRIASARDLLVRAPAFSTVIARSPCDEAIQTASSEMVWIASLRSQ